MDYELIRVENGEITLADETAIQIKGLLEAKAKFDKMEARLRDELLKAMEIGAVKKFDHPLFSATYTAAHKKETFDSKKFRTEYPIVYADFTKETEVKASVRIQIK